MKFALEWERRWDAGEGVANVSELCREFGISRETGYVWLRRFRAAGHDVKASRSGRTGRTTSRTRSCQPSSTPHSPWRGEPCPSAQT